MRPGQGGFAVCFIDQATAARPGPLAHGSTATAGGEDGFDGLMLQRAVLRRDLRLGEWSGGRG